MVSAKYAAISSGWKSACPFNAPRMITGAFASFNASLPLERRASLTIWLLVHSRSSIELREWTRSQIVRLARRSNGNEALKLAKAPVIILGALKGHADFQPEDIAAYFAETINVLLQDPDFPRVVRNVYGNLTTIDKT